MYEKVPSTPPLLFSAPSFGACLVAKVVVMKPAFTEESADV